MNQLNNQELEDDTLDPRTHQAMAKLEPTLRVVFEGGTGAPSPWVTKIRLGTTPIGRAQEPGAIALHDPRASRLHAEFVWDGRQLTIQNRSRFGTLVNGEPKEEHTLGDGDVLLLGESLAVVRLQPLNEVESTSPLWGVSPSMVEARHSIALLAPTSRSVLLLGPSGSGKEVAARALHEASGRSGPLVALNCAGIPEGLAESELFGHRAGAFTGAHRNHDGVFLRAHRGTLFLDELGELPAALQPKLLRVLETQEVTAVGGSKATEVDVRLVAATHRDLIADVEAGRFRGDLYARVAELTIRLSPLKERREDILALLQSFLERELERVPPLTPKLAVALLLHPWPFNVRELEKVAGELALRGRDDAVLDLPLVEERLQQTCALGTGAAGVANAGSGHGRSEGRNDDDTRADAGRQALPTRDELEAMLRRHAGVIALIARETGRSRKQVYRWLDKYGLDVEHFRAP